MDSRLLFGLGVSFIFGFLRWRFPAMPKPLATFGFVSGVGLLAWAVFPTFDWRWAIAMLAIVAAIAALLDALLSRGAKPAASPAPITAIDQRVTSHAQSGGITARNVGVSDVDR